MWLIIRLFLQWGYSGNVIILDFSRVTGVFCYATYGCSVEDSVEDSVEYLAELHVYKVNDRGTVDYKIDRIDDVTTERLVAA